MKVYVTFGAVFALLIASASASSTDVIVFSDGSRLEVLHYELKGETLLLTTSDGTLHSVPRSYINLEATVRLNIASATPTQNPAPPALSRTSRETSVARLVAAPRPELPTPVWVDEELRVSLAAPSSSWQTKETPMAFDVVVELEKLETEAEVTLAVVRESIRNDEDFQSVVREIKNTAESRLQVSFGPLYIEPYTAYEIHFLKDFNGVTVYNRLVVYYSRDLAYVLRLTCPQERLVENEADFEAFVGGLVIKKPPEELTLERAPGS